jgi:hypothetical protein
MREFIGKVRYRLFTPFDSEWNGVVRQITAEMEHEETVNTELVCVHLAEFYRARAHWANFKNAVSAGTEE